MDYKPAGMLAAALFSLLVSFVAPAELPDGLAIDHGYTWFDVEGKVDHQDGNPIDLGWTLKTGVRIIGETPNNSAFKIVIRRGKDDVLAEKRFVAQRSIGKVLAGEQYPTNPRPIAAMWVIPNNFATETPVVSGTGEFEVDVYYVDGATAEEYLAHTYTIRVGTVPRVRGPANKPQQDTPTYFVSRHQEALSTLLTDIFAYSRTSMSDGPYHSPETGGRFYLLWNTSPGDYRWSGPDNGIQTGAYLACTVNGAPLVWGNPESPQFETMSAHGSLDDTGNRTDKEISVLHSDRHSLDYRAGTPYKEYLEWQRVETTLPLTFKHIPVPENPPATQTWTIETATAKHPGKWDCKFIDNGEVTRIFRWEVNDDGTLKPHEEQEKGLTLAPNTILVETEIPEGGASFDGRLVPAAVQAGGFYGWKWKSSAMKKLAKAVPEVGNPFPVPSAPEFVAAPEKGPSPQELAKAKREAEAALAKAEREAEQEARAQQMEAAQALAAAEQEARAAELEKQQAEAMAKAQAETTAEVAAIMEDAQKSMVEAQEKILDAQKEAQRAAGSGGAHLILRILLSVSLLALGFILAGDALKGMVAQLAGVVDALKPQATTIGLVAIALALVDFLLDLVILRPLVGDGLPQLVALAGGAVSAKAMLAKQAALAKLQPLLNSLEAQSGTLGWACLAIGVVHLLVGGIAFL
jgi:hypothetical protein